MNDKIDKFFDEIQPDPEIIGEVCELFSDAIEESMPKATRMCLKKQDLSFIDMTKLTATLAHSLALVAGNEIRATIEMMEKTVIDSPSTPVDFHDNITRIYDNIKKDAARLFGGILK